MDTTIEERDMKGICPICKVKLDANKSEETKFVTYKKHKKILVCKKHVGVDDV